MDCSLQRSEVHLYWINGFFCLYIWFGMWENQYIFLYSDALSFRIIVIPCISLRGCEDVIFWLGGCLFQVSGVQVGKLQHHQSVVRDCSWHPSQPMLVSSSWDGDIVKWEFPGNGELAASSSTKRTRRRHYIEDFLWYFHVCMVNM